MSYRKIDLKKLKKDFNNKVSDKDIRKAFDKSKKGSKQFMIDIAKTL